MYQCIICTGNLFHPSSHQQICQDCGHVYPSIDGIPLFIPDAPASLQAYLAEMEEAKTTLTGMADTLREHQRLCGADEFSGRIARMLGAIQENLDVLASPYRPIGEFLQDRPTQPDFLAWSLIKTGTNFLDLLPYFYQDWAQTPDFEKVDKKVCQSILEHCQNRQSVAVLGAGACGLLHSVAGHFDDAYGVDLSLPTLLAAKTFMAGEPLSFHLADANWQKITLAPPKPTSGNIHFLTANVNNLPFKDGSLSLVVTQYLLDIVSNPLGLAKEIRRILKPDGVWINFSKPFRVNTDPPILGARRLDELPALFNSLGFDVAVLEKNRFRYLNLEKISDETDTIDQLIHYFVLKIHDGQADDGQAANRKVSRFFLPNDGVWHDIPRLVKGRGLIFSDMKAFDGEGGCNEWSRISVMGHTFPIPGDFALLLETLFKAIDGHRDLQAIFKIQEATIGLDKQAFLKLIYILNVPHYLIEF